MKLGGHAVGTVKNPSLEFLEAWQQCHSKKKVFIDGAPLRRVC
jgi:hypothetical protein